jgi:phage shock protein A
MATIEVEKFEDLMKDLKVGYKNQLNQLRQGLEQMIGQKAQLEENIPLLKAEIEKVENKLSHVTNLLPDEEEE